jgi:GDPmannose 4,6-dehydratase
MEISFEGTGLDEVGRDASGNVVVSIDPRYFRPAEVETLLGDPSKAHEKLGWAPTIGIDQLVREMAAEDLAEAKRHATL